MGRWTGNRQAIYGRRMELQETASDISEVLHEVNAISRLDRLGYAPLRFLRIFPTTIQARHTGSGWGLEPLSN